MATDPRIVEALTQARIDCDIANLRPEKSFRDNGIDSLDVMSLLLAVEEQWRVKFTEDEANAIRTPQELTEVLDAKLKR